MKYCKVELITYIVNDQMFWFQCVAMQGEYDTHSQISTVPSQSSKVGIRTPSVKFLLPFSKSQWNSGISFLSLLFKRKSNHLVLFKIEDIDWKHWGVLLSQIDNNLVCTRICWDHFCDVMFVFTFYPPLGPIYTIRIKIENKFNSKFDQWCWVFLGSSICTVK